MPPAKPRRQTKKMRTWTLPTVLGLLLGAVGAVGVIELRPQLTVTPQSELIAGQPFSAPFRITNSGYLAVNVRRIIIDEYQTTFRGWSMGRNIVGDRRWSNFTLERGDSKTVICRFINQKPDRADVVIVIEYTFLGVKWRRYFRFQGAYGDNWQWLPQPHDDIVHEIDEDASGVPEE